MRNEHAPRSLDAPTWARASIALLAFASLVLSLALTRPDVGWHPHLVTAALLLSALVGVAIPRGWIERATSWALTLGLAALVVTVAALTGGLSSAALDLLPLLVVAAALAHGFHGSVLVGAVGVGAVSVFFVTAARAPSAALPGLAALRLTHAAVLTLLALLAGVAARAARRSAGVGVTPVRPPRARRDRRRARAPARAPARDGARRG
ncbi:MAG: hypothetical protein H6713_36570 [Myxococcales bacterium]|nr:hypothetical protein [Myxococcales bacterium]